jgi:hypothetical protein
LSTLLGRGRRIRTLGTRFWSYGWQCAFRIFLCSSVLINAVILRFVSSFFSFCVDLCRLILYHFFWFSNRWYTNGTQEQFHDMRFSNFCIKSFLPRHEVF